MGKIWNLDAEKTTPDDLHAIFRPYQVHALNVVYAHPEGIGSGGTWREVNKMLAPDTISRASIIFYLNALVDRELLGFDDKTGKGGHHRVYKPIMTWEEFEKVLIWRFIEKLMMMFPGNTKLQSQGERLKIKA